MYVEEGVLDGNIACDSEGEAEVEGRDAGRTKHTTGPDRRIVIGSRHGICFSCTLRVWVRPRYLEEGCRSGNYILEGFLDVASSSRVAGSEDSRLVERQDPLGLVGLRTMVEKGALR